MTLTDTNPAGTAKLTTLDARGLKCPMPIVKTAQAIKTVTAGEMLEVLTTDPGAVADFAAWSRSTGNSIVEQTVADGVYRFVLQRK
ncbi:MAG: sulfurtransferase TusA family protein [Chloroflexota bacterium]|nr:sulfurtransferase TusA family protein [Chloroflexota bacterium]